MSVILILQVSLSLLGLSAQGLHLQHQDLPLSAQHQQLSLGAFCLVGGTDESVKKKKKKKKKCREIRELSCKCSGFPLPTINLALH